MTRWESALWPPELLPRAVAALVDHGPGVAGVDERAPPAGSAADGSPLESQDELVSAVAGALGAEVQEVSFRYGESVEVLKRAGPALVQVKLGEKVAYLALEGCRGRRVRLVEPSGRVKEVSTQETAAALFERPLAAATAEMVALFERAGLNGRRRRRALAGALPVLMGQAGEKRAWLIRSGPGAPLRKELQRSGLLRDAIIFLGIQLTLYLTTLASWWAIGRASLEASLEQRQLLAWAVLIVSQIPLQLALQFQRGVVGIGLGALLMRKFLYGALNLDLDEVRQEGSGRMLSRVIDSSSFGSLALNLMVGGVSALLQAGLAAIVLGLGAGGVLHALLLGGWIALLTLIGWGLLRRRLGWADRRAQMTNDLVERMVGHRTRLAQEAPGETWDDEDAELSSYVRSSAQMDRLTVALSALASQGWLAIGILGLLPAMVVASNSLASQAVSIGGILLGAEALTSLSGALSGVFDLLVAWRQVAPLYRASIRGRGEGVGLLPLAAGSELASLGSSAPRLVEARDIVFRYPGGTEPVLRDCSLSIARGDRLLLQGRSGDGKSTLCNVLSGMYRPDSGSILVRGWESRLVGVPAWRKTVICAPQFHENRLMAGPLLFNLLLGRPWPPREQERQDAEAVCRELGLGDLLDRMPRGLDQTVGETGWQLSHGERSRVFIARALLQGASLIILDEGLAALDPSSAVRVIDCVLRRAPALLLTAHL